MNGIGSTDVQPGKLLYWNPAGCKGSSANRGMDFWSLLFDYNFQAEFLNDETTLVYHCSFIVPQLYNMTVYVGYIEVVGG